MDFYVADSIFEKINKKGFFKIIDLGKSENFLNVLFENYGDLFNFGQQNVLSQHDIIIDKNEDSFFVTLRNFFDIICKEEESGKYRNYIFYTNKIVEEFFENNKCIIYVKCLYTDRDNIDTKSMFSECMELLLVDISKINMKSLSNTFNCCKKLKYVF